MNEWINTIDCPLYSSPAKERISRQVLTKVIPVPPSVKEKIPSCPTTLNFKFRDPMALMKQALEHSSYALDHATNMQFEFEDRRDAQNHRLVGELSWGDWWRDTESGERTRLA